MRHFLSLIVIAVSAVAFGQTIDQTRLDNFAHAIASAEGFGVKHAIPTRYHNPGDLKFLSYVKWDGQRGVGKGGHVVFRTDADGWAALKLQIVKGVTGHTKHYNPDMTILQMAKKYAGNWRIWSKNVAHNLGIPVTTKLGEFLFDYTTPPLITFDEPLPIFPVSAQMPVLAIETASVK